jgi:cellulose biosynthesis protein BcsS
MDLREIQYAAGATPLGPLEQDSEGEMARAVSTWLMVFVSCVLLHTGAARAQVPSSAAESPPIIEPNLFDSKPAGTAPLPAPNAAESPLVTDLQDNALKKSFDPNSIGAARAQYLPPPYVAQSPSFVYQPHVAVSSSGDGDSLGNRNAYVDGTFAPFGGIYESGPRFRLSGTASWYKFVATEEPRAIAKGRYLEGAFLAGYGIYVPGFSTSWFVGPAFGESVNEGVVTDRWGAKAAIEMSAQPTAITMASMSVSYSTIANNLKAQAKLGVRIFGDAYFGPEAQFGWQKIFPFQVNFSSTSIATTAPVSPQESVATTRVGAHVSAFNIGPVLFSISGGWAHDRSLGSGYYGSVSVYQPF